MLPQCIIIEKDGVAGHFQQYFDSPATSPAPVSNPYASPLPSPHASRTGTPTTPSDVDRALYHYYKHAPGLAECFKNAHKKFNVENVPREKVFEAIKEFVDAPVPLVTA